MEKKPCARVPVKYNVLVPIPFDIILYLAIYNKMYIKRYFIYMGAPDIITKGVRHNV